MCKQYKFYQYPRGVNKGGVLKTEICPTISTSSWEHNCLLIEFDANNQQFLKEMKENKEILRIPQATAQGYVEVEPGSLFDGSYPNSKTRRGRVQDNGQSSPILTANGEPPSYYEGFKDMNYRIRKLTPREVFRLTGVSETDIDKIQAAGISNSQQYKMAGNSIVVDVLEHIFRKLLVDRTQETQQLWMF